MQPQITKREYARGLQFHEVAITKRMRQRGYQRDYIFPFLARPGRKLTPACVQEIEQGKIGRSVEAAADDEVDAYIARRLAEAASADGDAEYGPLSTYQIGEALGWLARPQGDFLQDETQRVEFKLILQSDDASLLAYAKTLAAFANNRGGYIFFGIDDSRNPIGIDEQTFLEFQWDKLTDHCRESFQPDIRWNRALASWKGRKLGVIYVFEAESKPIIAARDRKGLDRGSIIYRYRGKNERIAIADLINPLAERDERVRRDLIKTLAEARAE